MDDALPLRFLVRHTEANELAIVFDESPFGLIGVCHCLILFFCHVSHGIKQVSVVVVVELSHGLNWCNELKAWDLRTELASALPRLFVVLMY